MLFEAELKGVHYEINVIEDRLDWKVGIKKDGGDWKQHSVSKRHYQELEQIILFVFNGGSYQMDVTGSDTQYTVFTRGSYRTVKIWNDEMILHESLKKGGSLGGGSSLNSGMPGKIVKIYVEKGAVVKQGQPILVMEAMKMENEMRAPKDVVIKDIMVKPGDAIEAGSVLVTFEV